MKRYIVFNGSSNSGVQTREKAIEWAKKEMNAKNGLFSLHLCEVTDTIERIAPAVTVRPFAADPVEEAFASEVAKAA